jgi:hypothetical protein
MNRSRLGWLTSLTLFAWLVLIITPSAASPTQGVPDAPDLMIRTRQSVDRPGATVTTEILYLKGARQRRESISEFPARADAPKETHLSTHITQCDERRVLYLNDAAKTYAYEPIVDMSAEIARARTAAVQRPAPPVASETPSGPVVTITIDVVDTGERRALGSYTARHVITTRKTEPGPGARAFASLDQQDGWYLDLPDANCEDGSGSTGGAFIIAALHAANERVEIKQRGTAKRGYPIEETHRSGSGQMAIGTRLELIEISEAPVDPALFTVPSGYRAALPNPYGGHDLSKPDTIENRVASYQRVIADWVDYLLGRRRGY